MSGADTTTSNDLIRGKCIISDRVINVLYESGAIHSFISLDCVKSLDFPVTTMPYDVVVSTPTDKPVTTFDACLGCSIIIHGRTFLVDFICLPFSCLDIVLGMDWLSTNHVLLNYKDKTLIFSTPSQENSRFVTREDSKLIKDVKAFMVLFSSIVEESLNMSSILVVNKFPEVFPQDITELPSERELELTIDLIPRSSPISIAPYCMSSV